jgi:N-methylhydantoinase A
VGSYLDELRQAGLEIWQAEVLRRAYIRYRGQGFEIRVDLERRLVDSAYLAELVDHFREAYAERYGVVQAGDVEVVDWYVTAVIPNPRASFDTVLGPIKGSSPQPVGQRPIAVGRGRFGLARVYRRDQMSIGAEVVGPCVIEERESTTVLFEGDRATVTPHGHLLIEVGQWEGS